MSDDQRTPNRQVEEKGKSFARFLIDTEFAPFVMVGKCINFFGYGTTLAFLAGVLATYVYGQLPNAPLHDALFPKSSSKKPEMTITGTIRNWDGVKLESVNAYLSPTRYTPHFTDGKFRIKVPEGDYSLIIIDPTDQNRHAIANISPDNKDVDLMMPTEVGIVYGRLVDTKGRPRTAKLVCISGPLIRPDGSEICSTTKSDGDFAFNLIPTLSMGTGSFTVKVRKSNEDEGDYRVETVSPQKKTDISSLLRPGDPVVSGLVTDNRGNPAGNVLVAIAGNYSAITAYDGRYLINVPDRGTYKIEVSRGSQQLYQDTIVVDTPQFLYNIHLK